MVFTVGAVKANARKVHYINLTTGNLAETSKTEIKGWKYYENKDASGEIKGKGWCNKWFNISGYPVSLTWFSKELESGGDISGYKLRVNCGEKDFLIEVKTSDRTAYRMFINAMLSWDSTKLEPIQFAAFKGDYGKVFLVKVWDDEKNDGVALQAKYPERWMSLELQAKIKRSLKNPNVEFDEKETRNIHTIDGKIDLAFNDDGVSSKYPYILQDLNNKGKPEYNFERWLKFLKKRADEVLVPKIAEFAKEIKEKLGVGVYEESVEEETSVLEHVDSVEDAPFPTHTGDVPFPTYVAPTETDDIIEPDSMVEAFANEPVTDKHDDDIPF